MSPARTPITVRSQNSIRGLPTEIEREHPHAGNFRLWLVDRLTKERILIAECDSPVALADWALEQRGASEVAHNYDLAAWENRR